MAAAQTVPLGALSFLILTRKVVALSNSSRVTCMAQPPCSVVVPSSITVPSALSSTLRSAKQRARSDRPTMPAKAPSGPLLSTFVMFTKVSTAFPFGSTTVVGGGTRRLPLAQPFVFAARR